MILGFKPRFVAAIEAGEKRHTIRGDRKIQPRPGELCHCYTGLRQKGARLLGRWPCVRVEKIEIAGAWESHSGDFFGAVTIEGNTLDTDELEQLARRDGFSSFAEMIEFWRGRLPFSGNLIHWDFSSPVKDWKRQPARRFRQ